MLPLLDCPIPDKAWHEEVGERNGAPVGGRFIQKTLEDAGPWEPTVRKIVECQELSNNWDGLGAVAPSLDVLTSAIGLAYLLYGQGIVPPHCVVPGPDGSVNFEWQDPEGTIVELEIDRPFHAEVMIIEPGKPPRFWNLPTE